MGKGGLYAIGAIVLIIIGSLLLRFELPLVSVSAEHLPGLSIFGLPVTNSYLTSWVVTIVIIVVAFLGTRNMQLVPSGLQNIIEIIVETLYNLTESVSGREWVGRFFIIPTTIFIYVLVSNWLGLIPGLAGIGLCVAHPGEEVHVEETEAHEETGFRLGSTCDEGEEIIPLFRSPSADLNYTLMLAVVTQIAAQVFGFMALGVGGYLGKFFVFEGIATAFKPDTHGNKRSFGGMLGQLALGIIDLFVGLLECLSEFVKVIAFTFRLFGNIFAGEVMLIVLTFLVPVVLTIPFLGFEVFVGLVQAFIFFILSVAFYTVAVTSHEHEEGH
jgi:F-type H+-transporting ATPase subunit a